MDAAVFLETLKDPEKLKRFTQRNIGAIKAWSGFVGCIFVLYWLFSDGDFSFMMTLSSLIGMFSFLMVVATIEGNKACKGVSLKMIECYFVLTLSRLCSIIPFEGYLPYDKSGDWLYQTVEAISFCLTGTVVYFCRSRFKDTYQAEADYINHFFLIIPAFLLSLVLHPSLNAFKPADVSWTFALYLESIACLPQLFMFHRQMQVEPFMSHFLMGQALSKAVSFVFWISSYSELNEPDATFSSYVGLWVIITQLTQLVVMCDFIYQYIRCIMKGIPLSNMVSENV